jgi:hypothetical protein
MNGNIVRDGHHEGRLEEGGENTGPGPWTQEGIRVTQEVDIRSDVQTPR